MADDFTVRFVLDTKAATTNAENLAKSLAAVRLELDSAQAPAQQVTQNLNAVSQRFTASTNNTTRATGRLSSEIQSVNNAYQSLSKRAESVSKGLETTLGRPDSGYRPTSFGQIEQSVNRLGSSLPTLRYAVYDVAATVGALSAGMLALSVSTYGVAIAWDREFANVVRTLDPELRTSTEHINTLKRNFQDLASVLPATSKELAEVGMLGGQMGISAEQLTSFASAVTRFTATSDVSTEATATAFGRLNALLPDVQGNFEALGSSIFRVAVNSVATETEIINIATQLSAIASTAGLTTGELVGLSGALASVGVRPELARGTFTRLFTLMSQAISGSADKLREFADVAGVSADEFASAYGTDRMGGVLLSFLNGLNDINEAGGDVNQKLIDLGINSVRDRPAILRLALAMDSLGQSGRLVNQTFEDGIIGFDEATELMEQYAVVSGTVSAKLQVLANNWENLLVVLGQGGEVFGGVIDLANDFLRWLTEIARNPVAGVIAQIVLVGTGLLGVLGGLATAALLGVGGLLAMVTALNALNTTGGPATLTLASINAQLATMGTLGRAASASLAFLRGGLIGLGVAAGAATFFGGIELMAAGLRELTRWAAGIDVSNIRSLVDAISPGGDTVIGEASVFNDEFMGRLNGVRMGLMGLVTVVIPGFGAAAAQAIDKAHPINDLLSELDDRLTEVAQRGDFQAVWASLGEIAERNGVEIEDVVEKFPRLREQIALMGGDSEEAADAVAFMTEQLVEESLALAQLAIDLELTDDELKNLLSSFEKGASQFVSFDGILKDLESAAKDTAQAIAEAENEAQGLKGKDAFKWEDFYEDPNLQEFGDALTRSNERLTDWATDLGIIAGQGYTNFAAGLAGLGPEGARLAKEAVDLSSEELMKLEEQAALAAFLASNAYAQTWAGNNEYLAQVYREGGIEAVKGMIAAQIQETHNGVPGAVAEFVNWWNSEYEKNPITPPVDVDLGPAERAMRAYKSQWENTPISLHGVLRVDSNITREAQHAAMYRASGGPVYGPGTGTSDSIPAWLSNGEYVIRAASVRKYGTGLFDALNRGAAKFAAGGQVGGGGTSFPSSMVTEFGPQSAAMIRGMNGPNVTIMLDDVAIAQAANRGNAKLVGQGIR